MATSRHPTDPVRTDLIEAGIGLLADQGADALVMRRVAAAADVSTMCVYSRFGDKAGLLNAVYLAGFERLESAMTAANTAPDPLTRVMDLALAYRSFALANPALYSLMFERMIGFDPPVELRTSALGATFSLVESAMTEAARSGVIEMASTLTAAYLVWTTAHGAVSLELIHAGRTPLPGWFIDSREAGEFVYRQVLETTLRGLTPTPRGRQGLTG
jgi:AcrR family transcriptional regulator